METDLLLDTHAFLWLLWEPRKVSPTVRQAVASPQNRCFLSIVSMWEICQKVRLKQMRLDMAPEEFFRQGCDALLVQELPLRPYMVFEAVDLPLIHRDPFDRMLICQAKAEGMILVTKDAQIRQYDVPTLW